MRGSGRRNSAYPLIESAVTLSVVIPVIDDAGPLAALLDDLGAQRDISLQIIVADGGSHDNSIAVARNRGATVVSAPAGRGRQMNAGAAAARGDWLCFVHADSRLTRPDQLARAVQRLAAQQDRRVAGHFPLRFMRNCHTHRFFYRFLEAKTATGRRYTINGDQGLVLRRDFFAELGRFDTRLPFLEDQRMAAAIERRGRWRLLHDRLATSARRFEQEGEHPRYWLMALIMAMYIVDVPVFFERAPQVYARHGETGRLRLMPYFRLLRRLMQECGPRASLAVAWRIAGVMLSQSWQLFLALDLALEPLFGRERYLTRLHDRVLRHVIVHPPARALLLIGGAAWLFGLMQLRYWLREREQKIANERE